MHLDWLQTALIERNICDYQATQAVDNCTVRNTSWRVAIAIHLRVGACEVKLGSAILSIDSEGEPNRAAIVHQILSEDSRD